MLGVGDPACDLSIAWTLFEGKSREVFRALLPLDAGTWARGRAWTLWKALIASGGPAAPSYCPGGPDGRAAIAAASQPGADVHGHTAPAGYAHLGSAPLTYTD